MTFQILYRCLIKFMSVEGGIFGSYTNGFQSVAHSLIAVCIFSLEPNQFCRHFTITVLKYFLNIVFVMMLIRLMLQFYYRDHGQSLDTQAGLGQNNKNMPNKFETKFGSNRCHTKLVCRYNISYFVFALQVAYISAMKIIQIVI